MAKKKKSNKLIYILLTVLVVLVIAAFVGKSMGIIGKGNQIDVTLAEAKKASITEKVSASGTVQPEVEVKISPDVPGEIIELMVEEGDSVVAGNLLIKIRPDNFQSALERTMANLNQQRANYGSAQARLSQSKAQLVQAQKEYERNKGLYDEKVISDSEFEAAEANYKVASEELESSRQSLQASKFLVASSQASVDEAQENLSLTSVFAPMSGTVSKLSVEKGERVVGTSQMAGTEMLRIADLTKMEVRVDVNENDIIKISVNDTALIDVDAYSYAGKEFKGIVTQIANTANDKISDDAVTEFEVRIRILNESYQDLVKEGNTSPFRPGMTASVDIITTNKENILTVPLASVTTRKKEEDKKEGNTDARTNQSADTERKKDEILEVVFVAEEGEAKMVEVKTGISDFDNIEVLEGLEEGQKVVAGPYLVVSKRLKDGSDINETKKKEKEEDE